MTPNQTHKPTDSPDQSLEGEIKCIQGHCFHRGSPGCTYEKLYRKAEGERGYPDDAERELDRLQDQALVALFHRHQEQAVVEARIKELEWVSDLIFVNQDPDEEDVDVALAVSKRTVDLKSQTQREEKP